MNNEPEDLTGVIILDCGLNRDECKAMCTSTQIPLREKLFFRMVYETTTRPREVLEVRIELWNRTTCEITFPIPKSRYNRWTRRHIPGAPRTMKLTGSISAARCCGIMLGTGRRGTFSLTVAVYQTQREAGERQHDRQWW
jgi:hypothetical protein